MRRTKHDAESTRLNIMAHALDLFSQRGVSSTSLVDIAANAGVTRGAIYWHFQNKWDLFESIWQHYAAPVQALSKASHSASETDPLGKLAELLKFVFVSVAEQENFRRMFTMCLRESVAPAGKDGAEPIQALMREWHNNCRLTLDNAVKKSQLPKNLDIEAGAIMLRAMVEGIVLNWISTPERYDLSKRSDQFVDAIIGVLKHSLTL